jgi:hypothetical protein
MSLHLLSIAARPPPDPPEGLDGFEALVMASAAPAVLMIDRQQMRALLEYVRRLEREAREGWFW